MTVTIISSFVTPILGQAQSGESKADPAVAILKGLAEKLACREDASIDSDLLGSMGFAPTLGYASTTPGEIPVAMKKLQGLSLQLGAEQEQAIIAGSVEAMNALIRRNEDYIAGLDIRRNEFESRIAEQEGRISSAIASMDGLNELELGFKEGEVKGLHLEVGKLEKELNNLTIHERLAKMQVVAGINSITVWMEKIGVPVIAGSEYSNATLELRKRWKGEAIQTYSFLTTAHIDGAATRAGAYRDIDRFLTGFGDPDTLSHSERMEFIEGEYQTQLKRVLKDRTISEFIELERVAGIAGVSQDKLDSELKKVYPVIRDQYLESADESVKSGNFESAGTAIAKAASITEKLKDDGSGVFSRRFEELNEKIIEGEIADFAEHARFAQHNSDYRFGTSLRWDPVKNFIVDDKVASVDFMRSAGVALNSFAVSPGAKERLVSLFAESGASVVKETLMNAKNRRESGTGTCVASWNEHTLSCGEYFLYSFAEELIRLSQSSEGVPDFDPTRAFEATIRSTLP